MTVAFAVKSGFEYSPALVSYIERRIEHALHTHATHISRVLVRLADINGPRHGARDKVARFDITLVGGGHVMATGASDNLYTSVARVAFRAKTAVSRHIEQRLQRARRTRRDGRGR
jgi:ribosome-associated translation inhibitor RaiA